MFFPYLDSDDYIFIYKADDVDEEVIVNALTKLTTALVKRGYTLEEIQYLIYLKKLDGK